MAFIAFVTKATTRTPTTLALIASAAIPTSVRTTNGRFAAILPTSSGSPSASRAAPSAVVPSVTNR